MKAKTHVAISLFGAVFLMGYYIFNICYQWPLRLSRKWTLYIFIVPFIVLVIHIICITRKDLKTIKIIYGIWHIFSRTEIVLRQNNDS